MGSHSRPHLGPKIENYDGHDQLLLERVSNVPAGILMFIEDMVMV